MTINNNNELKVSHIEPGKYPLTFSFESDINRYVFHDTKVQIIYNYSIHQINRKELYYFDNEIELVVYFDKHLYTHEIQDYY